MRIRNLIAGIVGGCLSVGVVLAANPQYISVEKAQAIAKSKIPGGTVISTELDHEYGRMVYDIDVILNQYEYDLKLDATTGKGISIRKELRDGYKYVPNTSQKPNVGTQGTTNVPSTPSVPNTSNGQNTSLITSEKAKSIALQKVPGATVIKLELDREDGVYEIELRKGYLEYDIEVGARTGKILKFEVED